MNARISELKARLSSYLDAVRRGATVVVFDHKTAIAKISPLTDSDEGLEITHASRPPADIATIPGVRLKKPVDLAQLLASTRGER
jgi:antitoxin (DNA-binding transcriptional repressor) of toxin-antitoxin stability system